MSEGEVVPAPGQEGGGAKVLFPLSWHARRVIEFHLRVLVEEDQEPFLHPLGRPCASSRHPDLASESGHESALVLREKRVLTIISFQPTIHEALVQIHRAETTSVRQSRFHIGKHLADHGEKDGLLGEGAQVVDGADGIE